MASASKRSASEAVLHYSIAACCIALTVWFVVGSAPALTSRERERREWSRGAAPAEPLEQRAGVLL